jgi:predicted cupin superfamily sugar epimerase
MAALDNLDPDMDAEAIIALLDLKPHPVGGHFRETFRDPATVGGRAASTAIHFLLRAGETSRWHRVDAVEVWHWYKGAPLLLSIAPPSGPAVDVRLGPGP